MGEQPWGTRSDMHLEELSRLNARVEKLEGILEGAIDWAERIDTTGMATRLYCSDWYVRAKALGPRP